MKVLVIGGGGAEHALIWKLSRSKHVTKIHCSPGNAGIAGIAECINVEPQNVSALVDFVKYEWIDLTIVCSATPLAQNILDTFDRHGCRLYGLHRGALTLGTSRVASKDFMKRHRIPTAEYQVFSSPLLAQDYVQMKGLPLVIKTNSYPGERGVFTVTTMEDAADILNRVMKKKIYGESGNRAIIEEHLNGDRISLMSMADDKSILPLASISKTRGVPGKDKDPEPRVYNAYSPVTFMTKEIEKDIMDKVMYPVHKALTAEGILFRGFVSADIIVRKGDMYLSELSFGFGNLDAQVMMPVLKADIGELILSASEGSLSGCQIKEDVRRSFCLSLYSRRKRADEGAGFKIKGLDVVRKMEDVFVFHENTEFEKRDIHTPGEIALYVTGVGEDLTGAQTRACDAAKKIHFEGMRYRKDIEVF